MKCASNFAWANRQMIAHLVRDSFRSVLGEGAKLAVVYDMAHNIAKVEKHGDRDLLVHRKGATRAFPPNHPEVPPAYRSIGQPVIIPGSMGTASYVLLGTDQSMREAFGSTCHGAGRTMSRHAALRLVRGEALKRELEGRGIEVRGLSWRGLAEEAPLAYKDIDAVVETVVGAGIARRVARLVPVGVVKG
jgi:tRNA-splicing ligase RtcB